MLAKMEHVITMVETPVAMWVDIPKRPKTTRS